MIHGQFLVHVSGAVSASESLELECCWRICRNRLADSSGGFLIGHAGTLAYTVGQWVGTSQVQRPKLPATCPKRSTGIAARVTEAKPLARATGQLPVADLYLSVGTVTAAGDIQGSDRASSVNALALIAGEGHVVVHVTIAAGAVPGLEAKGVVSCDTVEVVRLEA